jgi:hypothetical protein
LIEEGIKLKDQRKFEQAFKMFEQAGNRGYARGWSCLIGLYSEEKGVKPKNGRTTFFFFFSRLHTPTSFPLSWSVVGFLLMSFSHLI